MVYIRTDANEKIATGHVMRCLPIAEEISKTVLSIPMYYGMTDEEVNYVIDKLNAFK